MGEMNKLIDAIINKWFCCHEWEIIKTTEYTDSTEYTDCFVHLLKCKKCGKLKKKRV